MKETTTTKDHLPISNNGLNKLRAAVLGANDGIVSVAGIVLGVAGASANKQSIVIAGVAGLVSGALSMAAGEFVSVSSQRDSEHSFLLARRKHISKSHDSISEEMVEVYIAKGFSRKTATVMVKELQSKNLMIRELEYEAGINPDDINNPWSAAVASAISFVLGASIPLLAMSIAADNLRIWFTVGAVVISLALTGIISAVFGQANKIRAALRVVIWGIGAMVITYGIGHFMGVAL